MAELYRNQKRAFRPVTARADAGRFTKTGTLPRNGLPLYFGWSAFHFSSTVVSATAFMVAALGHDHR
jgi:hypothetical protein